MRGPSHWLGTVPTRDCVCRESRVYKSEMGFVVDIVEIVEVVVYLDGGELTFVNDVLVA